MATHAGPRISSSASSPSEQIQQSVFPTYNGQKDVDTALSEIRGFLETTIE